MEKLLVVDDDQEVTTLLFDIFTACGYSVTCASNGAEALALFKENFTYDLVLTDLHMPFLNGFQLSQILNDLYPDVEVLIMTGGSNRDIVLPVNIQVIQKPFSIVTVKETIRSSLTKQKEKRES